jgi:hypothetical protein
VPGVVIVKAISLLGEIGMIGSPEPQFKKLPSDFKAIPNSEKYFAFVPAPVIVTRVTGGFTGDTIVS